MNPDATRTRPHRRARARTAAAGATAMLTFVVAACGGSDGSAGPATTGTPVSAERCITWLHGKSETGAPSTVRDDGVAELSPTGNGEAGDGNEWIYFPDDRFVEATAIVAAAIDRAGCRDVVLGGFSNGGAFAGALYCSGETFDDRLLGVVVDDPPPDEGVVDCAPAPGVEIALYWTGALDDMAVAGAECDPIGWTCAGGRLLGLDAYADALGTEVLDSPNDDHVWYRLAPELTEWLQS